MTRRLREVIVFSSFSVLALAGLGSVSPALASALTPGTGAGSVGCGPGAHTLSPPGARMYPDTGNGGYGCG